MKKEKIFGIVLIIVIFIILFIIITYTPIINKFRNNGELIISEVLSSNKNTIADAYGNTSDYIEIYNGYDYEINLEGYYLSDDNFNTKKWKFGEEIADTTEVQIKNVEYINDQPVFTKDDNEIGFLYIYDSYISKNTDLFLENDSEQRLFNQLEEDSSTYQYSNVIKYLLYVYDGVDRGVTSLNLKVIDIEGMNKVKGSSTANYIKAWENGGLWTYETGQSTVFPTGYLSEDELYYIVYEDGSAGHNNISYGICTFISSETNVRDHNKDWGDGYYNWKEAFAEEGILVETLYEGASVDRAVADSVFQTKVLKSFVDKVNDYLDTNLPEYKFTRAQKDSLISVCYQYGNIIGFKDVYLNALNEDGTIDADKMREWSRYNYSATVNDRKYANWLLFTEGSYVDRAGNRIAVGSGSIVEAAYEVADYFNNSGVEYFSLIIYFI